MHRYWIAAPWVLTLALTQAACSPDPAPKPKTAGEQVDSAIEQTQQTAAEVKADIKQEAREIQQSTEEASSASSTAMSDTAVTARVKARLATDKELESMDIQVDTDHGRVVLRGTAPNASAQSRAKELASSVEGARNVDNLLTVKQP